MSKNKPDTRSVLEQVQAMLGDIHTLLTNAIAEDAAMETHHRDMAARLLTKLEVLEDSEYLDLDKKRAHISTLKAELRFHLANVSIGAYPNKAHARINRKGRKPITLIPKDII